MSNVSQHCGVNRTMRGKRGVSFVVGGLMMALAIAVVSGQTAVVPTQGPPGLARPPQNTPPLIPGKTAILGRVVEAGGNTGVAGAVVILNSPALGRFDALFTNGVIGGPRRVVADAQGQFVFRDLPPGTYNIDTTAVGYVDGAYGQNKIIQMRRTLDLNRTIQISESDQLVQTTITMFRKGGISGRVIDEAGDPMVGISLTILARQTDWGGPATQISQFATTDDRGQYHVDVVPGDYLVGVLAATQTFPVELMELFVRSQMEGGAEAQKVVEQLVSASGILPRGIGTKIGAVRVSQYGPRNVPVVPPMSTDGSAWFYPSTYHPASLTPMGASLVSVSSGEEKSGIDLQLRPVPVRRISGRIVGPDGPAGGFGLRLISADPTVQRTSPATLIDVPRAMADSKGSFVFIGVVPGAYHLYAIKQGAGPDQSMLWAYEPITVGDSDVKDIEIRLKPGATIRGRVVFEGANPPTAAQVRAVYLTPRGVPGSTAGLSTVPSARANADGTFITTPLVPGLYQMTLSTAQPGWALKTVTTNGQNAVDKNFELTATGITDMVVTFTDKRSVLTGLVRNADGEPDAAAAVAVFPIDRTLWRVAGMASRRVQTAAPQRDGRYTFGTLPEGEYYVVGVHAPDADFSDGRWLTKMIPFAARVTIVGGQDVTQDLKVTVIR